MKHLPARMRVIVLVATRYSSDLLSRALASVAAQSSPPEALIVVLDEPDPDDHSPPRIDDVELPTSVELIVLRNRRTTGLSGALNSGIDEIARRIDDFAKTYVAVLDDDDWWDSEHLSRSIDMAEQNDANVVAARLIRHDDDHPQGRPLSNAPTLDADRALVRNTGIQGSNLVVRLSTLLEAGCFDEALQSTTDRDLVIRLSDLGARFVAVDAATVHHDALSGRDRLSTPGSSAKASGLRQFQRKYCHRMTHDQLLAFRKRAFRLFSIDVDAARTDAPKIEEPLRQTIPDALDTAAPLHLVVGIAADGNTAGVARVSRLLVDLHALVSDPRLATLDTVLLENDHGGEELASLVERYRRDGLHCRLARVEDQCGDAAMGLFGPGFKRASGRVGIADTRTMLQRYTRFVAPPGAVVWILDDDKRLAPLTLRDGRLARRAQDTIGHLLAVRDSGVDIALGTDTGAAPLPASMTMRTQLVDLQANLTDLRAMPPNARWPERLRDNLPLAMAAPDAYYHDLARDLTSHLEQPFGFVPETRDTAVRVAFLELCSCAPRLLAGEQVFRPLFVDAVTPLMAWSSVHRGGSTIFMDLDALVDVPQRVPETDGRPSRRSDMVSAILNAAVKGRRVEQVSFAVHHDRTDLEERPLDTGTLVDDIRGFALYSVLKDLIADGVDLERPDSSAFVLAQRLHTKYLRERSASLVLSLTRARGAARTARRTLTDTSAWWWSDPECTQAAHGLMAFVDRLLDHLAPTHIDEIRSAVTRTHDDTMERWLTGLGPSLETARVFHPVRPDWLVPSRVERATSIVERLSSPERSLTLLGHGKEGVVFSDGRQAFKCLDRWQARATAKDRRYLNSLIGTWANATSLLPLTRLDEAAGETVLVMPHVRGAPYRGGYGSGLVALLQECRKHSVACRNLHPKNLIVDGNDVRLVDYGSDIRPLDAREWRHMVRRAWLCWRWAEHPDLGELMTRALVEELPEVDGWERLEQAVLAGDAKNELDALVLDAVLAGATTNDTERAQIRSIEATRTVLDFGCSSGELVRQLAKLGARVVGYDPFGSRHWNNTLDATYTTVRNEALTGGPYDTVVCSLVLCTLDDADYRQALEDLRSAVRHDGRVIVAVCHPFHTRGGDTPFQSRIERPDSATFDDEATFTWVKRVRQTGNLRRDIHRPLHVLRRDLLRAGIVVESTTETESVDLERFERTSDFIVLHGRAVTPGPDVSLLVRACALEWRTLEVQIRHVVGQLETPRAFRERLVVLDTRVDGFTRSHGAPDREAARAVLDQLVIDGTIDRVVEPPTVPKDIRALHERWFGLRTESTHTVLGAPVTSTLAGFEACSCKYILHVDDDLMILKTDPPHDVLQELSGALNADKRNLAASLNIVHAATHPLTHDGPDGPKGIEVRGTLLHHARLLDARPWPNEVIDGMLSLSWHRSLDRACDAHGLRSLRGGRAASGFVHPPNVAKEDVSTWLAILDRVEHGYVPDVQTGRVDLVGTATDWLGPPRPEPLVVIACGRNVSAGRVARFCNSIDTQQHEGFGLIVIEDGGHLTARDVVRQAFAGRPRTTVLTLPDRRGAIENLVMVLRHMCPNPHTVVVLVDLDDALLGTNALCRVMQAFNAGHDLAVGGMRRTDKATIEIPCFENPRGNRGGAVWHHLRAFRRSLFDRVPDAALRDDHGQYFDLASDWALMITLTELADAPHALDGTLYLHEPSGHGKRGRAREERETIISRILARPPSRQLRDT